MKALGQLVAEEAERDKTAMPDHEEETAVEDVPNMTLAQSLTAAIKTRADSAVSDASVAPRTKSKTFIVLDWGIIPPPLEEADPNFDPHDHYHWIRQKITYEDEVSESSFDQSDPKSEGTPSRSSSLQELCPVPTEADYAGWSLTVAHDASKSESEAPTQEKSSLPKDVNFSVTPSQPHYASSTISKRIARHGTLPSITRQPSTPTTISRATVDRLSRPKHPSPSIAKHASPTTPKRVSTTPNRLSPQRPSPSTVKHQSPQGSVAKDAIEHVDALEHADALEDVDELGYTTPLPHTLVMHN
jgi:hypothetical protein